MSHYAGADGRFSAFDTAPAFRSANWSANVSFPLRPFRFTLVVLLTLAFVRPAVHQGLTV